jgi:hypothetical protein
MEMSDDARERRVTTVLRVSEILNTLVRPVLAVVFSCAYVSMALMGIDPGDAFVALVTAVILWFFKARDDEKAQQRLEAKQEQITDLAKQLPPPA